jgi:outer membrane protein assembly factor BamB
MSFHFEGIWQRLFPLDPETRVLFGDKLLGFVGDRALTADGISIYLLDRERGAVQRRIGAPGAQATHVWEGDDHMLLVWRRPGQVEDADKTPCGLAAYDPRRGRMRWQHRACDFLDADLDRRLAAASAGHRLVVLAALTNRSSADAVAPTALVAVSWDTGRLVWRQPGPPRLGALDGDRKRIYIASRETALALDPATGRTLWQERIPPPTDPALARDPELPVVVTAGAVEGDPVVAAGDAVVRLDAASGTPRWTRALPGAGAAVQVVRRDDVLLVVAYRGPMVGSLVALDGSNGSILWAREVWQPAIIGGAPAGPFVASLRDGLTHRLSVIDPRDGAALAEIDLGGSFTGPAAIAGRDGYAIARSQDSLIGFRLRPGADDPDAAPAQLDGTVRACYHRCAPRSGIRIHVTGARAEIRAAVSGAGGRFTLPLRQGELTTASVDHADLESLQNSLRPEARAEAPFKRMRCHQRDRPEFVAYRARQTVKVDMWIDCQVLMPD